MAVLYLGAAWLLMQVADLLINQGVLAEFLGRLLLIVLSIGFPIALLLSWFYELTPEGILPDEVVASAERSVSATGRTFDFVVIAVLTAALLLFAYDKWYPDEPPQRSIAVLPFVNMSADEEIEYLCTGVAETILNMLAQTPKLHVVSATSSFQSRLDGLSVPEIAALLGVATVLEGSVQRQGNRLRITAQLIDAEADNHLWSRNFDRDDTDIFAIQDEIAAAVASALRIAVRDDVRQRIDLEGTDNAEAYDEYLMAESLYEAGQRQQAMAHIERAIELDPEYALAHVWMGYLYRDAGTLPELGMDEKRQLGLQAANRAIELAPDMPAALVLLASYAEENDTRGELLKRAYENGPNDVEAILAYAAYLIWDPDPKLSELLALKALSLDPLTEQTYWNLTLLKMGQKRMDQAFDIIELWKEKVPGSTWALAMEGLYHQLNGDYYSHIATEIEALKLEPENPLLHKWGVVISYLIVGMPEQAQRWFDSIKAPERIQDWLAVSWRVRVNAYYQRNDEEIFNDSRQLLLSGVPKGSDFRGTALTWFVEYGNRLGRLDEVLATFEELYPQVLSEPPPLNIGKPESGMYYQTAKVLLLRGDTAVGEPLMRAFLDEQEQEDRAYNQVHPSSIVGSLLLGDRELALEKFRRFAELKWVWAGDNVQMLFRDSSLFDQIRDEPEFIALLEVYEQNAAEQRHLLKEADFAIPTE